MWGSVNHFFARLRKHCGSTISAFSGQSRNLAADLRAIARRSAAHVKRPHIDHAEFLYDEHDSQMSMGFPALMPFLRVSPMPRLIFSLKTPTRKAWLIVARL